VPLTLSKSTGGNREAIRSGFPFAATVEVLFLLVYPLCVFFALHFKPIAQKNMLDPYIYTGYINNFCDLFHRYGMTYYGVRFGLILPGRILTWLLGPEAGYFALRYLLALIFGVALYSVVKNEFSTTIGIIVYAISVSSPYLARALLWDHPDASGVPFLTAAICLILLEQVRWKMRSFIGGSFAGMAVHSNVFTVAILGIFVACYSLIWLRQRRSFVMLLKRLLFVALGIVLVTLVGCIYYWKTVGSHHIFGPTITNAIALSSGGMRQWRVPGVEWTMRLFHVFVPVWLAVCCVAIWSGRRRALSVTVIMYFGVTVTAFYYIHQFLLAADTLQLFYYFSYFMPAIFLMGALIIFRLWQQARVPGTFFVALSLTVTLTPWILVSIGRDIFGKHPLHIFVLTSAMAFIIIVAASYCRPGLAARVLALGGVVLLGIALDWGLSFYSNIIQPRSVVDTSEIDVYRVALKLIAAVPKLEDPRGRILFWYKNKGSMNPINSIQSTFLWGYSKMNRSLPEDPGLPTLSAEQVFQLQNPEVRYLGLLCASRAELETGLRALIDHRVEFREVERRNLAEGNYTVWWELVQLHQL
jgi:hypothetical protein